MNSILKTLLLAALVGSAATANALVIEISEDSNFATGISVADTDNDGLVTLSGSLSTWIVNVVTGLSNPLIGNQYVDALDLNSVNVSGGAGTLYLRLTDTDMQRLGAAYTTLFGGTTNGSVSFQTYMDDGNTPFGTGTLLTDSGVLGAAFSGSNNGHISATDPYSLSIYATINHTGAGQVTSFDYYVAVPEPGSLALLGLGLLGVAFARRRLVVPAKNQ